MKIIQKLSDRIEDEIKDGGSYAKLALEVRDMHPSLAEVLYSISVDEFKHMSMLHEQVVKLIEEYRKANGDPPPEMQARYDYLHERHIDLAKEAKIYQAMYRER